MRRSILFWVFAFVITLTAALYQRMTGPSYPVRGTVTLNGKTVDYTFHRSHITGTNYRVTLVTGDQFTRGVIEWKRHKTNDAWTVVQLQYENGALSGEIPSQPVAGKLEYRLVLHDSQNLIIIPSRTPVVIRFRGDVPLAVMILHIICIFTAMLLSTRTGLEIFAASPQLVQFTNWSLGFLIAGGLIFGPIMQRYAFDAFWTGWPLGSDLTDNKTGVAVVMWLIARFAVVRAKNAKFWIAAASVITLAVFLIPHSLLGSEIDYSKLQK